MGGGEVCYLADIQASSLLGKFSAFMSRTLESYRFTFDDHIRCMAAKQRLTKGRLKARQQKMQMIERLLEIPVESTSHGHFSRSGPIPGIA